MDTASPQQKGVVGEGPRLYKVDLSTGVMVRTYLFSEESYRRESYLNDVRIDTEEGVAYLTDSGTGGIVVVDLETGESWRALDSNCPAVCANLPGIDFKSTGWSGNITHSDGLELSADKKILYFSALTADVIHQVPVAVLRDRTLSVTQRCEQVTVLNPKNVSTDGMILYQNKLYMGNLPEEGIWEFDLSTRTRRTLHWGETIRWADSFAKDTDGYIYFTTSQINYPEEQRVAYGMFKFKPE
ncbi:MAG: major royal jelly family protein [Bacteroides sp.]|nr:major royal jelly family protein [Bacteroides sp.]